MELANSKGFSVEIVRDRYDLEYRDKLTLLASLSQMDVEWKLSARPKPGVFRRIKSAGERWCSRTVGSTLWLVLEKLLSTNYGRR
jgi:hypothetical protein